MEGEKKNGKHYRSSFACVSPLEKMPLKEKTSLNHSRRVIASHQLCIDAQVGRRVHEICATSSHAATIESTQTPNKSARNFF